MNEACHGRGKSLLNEQRACCCNSAWCCIAPCLPHGGCGVLREEHSGVPGVPWGCAWVQPGSGRGAWLLEAARCQDASQQTLRCWGSSISLRGGESCRAL